MHEKPKIAFSDYFVRENDFGNETKVLKVTFEKRKLV